MLESKTTYLTETINYTPNMLYCDKDIWLITLHLASDGCSRPNQKSIVVHITAWAVTEVDTRQPPTVYISGSHPYEKYYKKKWIKDDKLTDSNRAYGHYAADVQRYRSVQWETYKRSTDRHIMYAVVHLCLYQIQIVTE